MLGFITPHSPVAAAVEPGKLMRVGPLTMKLCGCVASTRSDACPLATPSPT